MSKRKGRKPALNSEIKSVLRAPDEAERELEASLSADEEAPAVSAGDGQEDESLPLDVLSEVGASEDADAARALADEPSESTSRPPRGSRRLRSVQARSGERAVEAPDADAADADALDTDAPDTDAPDAWGSARSARGSIDYHGDEDGVSNGHTPEERTDQETRGDEDDDDDGGERVPLPPFPIDADGDDTENFLRGLVEALLFTSQKPLDLKDIARSAGVDKPRAKELVEQLVQIYEGRGLCIEEVAGGFVMRSSARYAPYIQKILALRPVRLSRAQLETLAIVAYRQPVTKPEVDDIRGVDSGQVIKGLLERSLLKMLGKKDEPGRPTLYGTTNDFLELLNLQSLKDLPTLREYTELSEESQRKFLEETGEAVPSTTMSFERPPSPVSESAEGEPLGDGESADADGAHAGGARAVGERPSSTGESELDAADARVRADEGSDDTDEWVAAESKADPGSDDGPEPEGDESDEDDDDESDDDDDESDDDDDESDDDDDESDDDDDDDDDESDDDEGAGVGSSTEDEERIRDDAASEGETADDEARDRRAGDDE